MQLDLGIFDELVSAYSELHDEQLEKYSGVLTSARVVLDGLREQERRHPKRFNVFRALGHEYREVGTHSAMLAFLLDPLADHCQRAVFLDLFLRRIETARRAQGLELILPHPKENSLSEWSCRKEVVLRDNLGRADIVLRAPEIIVVVENKVYATLGDDQLARYWEYAQQEARDVQGRNAYVVYLTPDGRAPDDRGGAVPKESLICLSYCDDIYQFLQDSVKAVKEAFSVAEIVRQYACLVRSLA